MDEQQNQPLPTNPETTFHTYLIFQERRRTRRSGVVIVVCSLALLLGALIALHDTFSAHQAVSFPTQFVTWGILLAGALSLVVGVMELRSSAKRITDQEVGLIRQQARTELMSRAQGYVPWSYRRSACVLEALFACLWLYLGVSFFFLPIVTPSWFNDLFAVLSLLGAIWFLLDALIWRPRRAKRLAAESAQELTSRLSMGEATEGQIRTVE